MDMNIIKQDWNALAGKRMQFAHAFYTELFARHPQYRSMFPASDALDSQMEKMVEMFSGVARFADHSDLIRPYLVSVGYAHRRLGIGAVDVNNFKEVFIAVLAQLRKGAWDASHDSAWREAFEDMIVPMFDEGLETGRR
jgi:hemoglobin-like flavoprotein